MEAHFRGFSRVFVPFPIQTISFAFFPKIHKAAANYLSDNDSSQLKRAKCEAGGQSLDGSSIG